MTAAGEIGADNRAQFIGAGVKVERGAEFALSLAKVDGDRAINVGGDNVRMAIAVEIGHEDPFGPILLVWEGDGRVPDREAIAKGLEILEKLSGGVVREEGSDEKYDRQTAFQ